MGFIICFFNCYEYFFVFCIVFYFCFFIDKIYVYWVLVKVCFGFEDDDIVCCKIVEKFFGKLGILFEVIVRVVYEEGRGCLVIELFNYEF